MDIATSSRQDNNDGPGKKNLKGTGGTALIPFLKQARDETGEPAVNSWAKRAMTRSAGSKGQGDFFMGKAEDRPEEVEVGGLAGTWTIDDNAGGICHY